MSSVKKFFQLIQPVFEILLKSDIKVGYSLLLKESSYVGTTPNTEHRAEENFSSLSSRNEAGS